VTVFTTNFIGCYSQVCANDIAALHTPVITTSRCHSVFRAKRQKLSTGS